ncbi:PulJ/GspJ family protein [Engelhardtia mirabilis]|uniref:Uncharacterized protein n=1 Tax=Engelhardtia mirabilis TaxID=2528011 RepID=A0A518BLI2_9BACT|nr:hypothetical protein Pla133_29130 [Planctomycetes bacterium Pla133]QDV02150.1 hypothetical protein Pla86_29120 [Planctomycetes bacterium Pla86]
MTIGAMWGAKRRRRGFSVLELMLAMTVMTVGLVAAFSGQIGTQQVMRQSRETQLVLTRLETVMEYIHAQKPEDLPTNPVVAHGKTAPLDDDLGLDNLKIITLYDGYVPGVEPPDPLHFKITGAWTDFEGRQRSLTLASVVTR